MGVTDTGGNRTSLVTGPARVLYAPSTTAIPADITGVIGMVSPYTPATGWIELGFTNDGVTYEQSMRSDELYVEQQTDMVAERITQTARSVATRFVEIDENKLKLAEEGGPVTTITAAAGKGAQKKVRAGSIQTRASYRLAVVAERDQSFGSTVVEPGGATRGPLVAIVGFLAQLAPERQRMDFSKGALVGREIQWNLYPDNTVTQSNEHTLSYLIEQPGTIT